MCTQDLGKRGATVGWTVQVSCHYILHLQIGASDIVLAWTSTEVL
jgi:hypothetical protein